MPNTTYIDKHGSLCSCVHGQLSSVPMRKGDITLESTITITPSMLLVLFDICHVKYNKISLAYLKILFLFVFPIEHICHLDLQGFGTKLITFNLLLTYPNLQFMALLCLCRPPHTGFRGVARYTMKCRHNLRRGVWGAAFKPPSGPEWGGGRVQGQIPPTENNFKRK